MGRTTSVLGSFLLGGIIGAGFGVLFAPRSGAETREYLSEKALDYWEQADEAYEVGRERVLDFYETGLERATDVVEVGREKAAEATDQVRHTLDAARERLIGALDHEEVVEDDTVAGEA